MAIIFGKFKIWGICHWRGRVDGGIDPYGVQSKF